jgi:uracil phosphoribosyltransferase
MVVNLGKTNSIFNQYVAEIRDINIQKDSMRFRKNLARIGEIAAYEISKTMDYQGLEIITPLGVTEIPMLQSHPVIIPILRAGLPMHEGMQQIFDRSESGFISAYRKVSKSKRFTIKVEYVSCPDLKGKVVIVCDPMLATGSSVVAACKALATFGKPKHLHIVTAIASAEGISLIKRKLPSKNLTIWTGAIDDELTAQAYIVPGLGDAGDLSYGNKLDS